MTARNYLATLLVLGCMAFMASAADQIALTIHVHEGDLNGTLLSGVRITGQDASGEDFDVTTDSDGIAIVKGEPGTWTFAFEKSGYETLYLNWDATKTEDTAAYLEKTSSQEVSSSQDQVTLTIYVHEGSLDGDLLSGVQISGEDAAGNSFQGTTDSSGTAVITGAPGSWQFTFEKRGYETLTLKYDAAQTEATAAYLEKST
ncbi:MAG: hypothetical protein GYA39_09060 [Methanothrix sp.]|nr:hypothetical protein [Methanothrix sp.]